MGTTTWGSTSSTSQWRQVQTFPTTPARLNPARLLTGLIITVLIASGCGGDSAGESATTGARGDAAVTTTDEAASDPAGEQAGDAAVDDVPRPADDGRFVVGAVMPTGRDDRGFSQSLVDSLLVLQEQGLIDELQIADNTVLDEDALDIFRDYATSNVDLIFGHGPQYGGVIAEIAEDYPNTAFAWGYADETFGLDNITAYDAAAGEGAYVLGHVAARVIGEGSIALLGPSALGDDRAYIDGFFTGVAASGADMDVVVQYIESYIDVDVAAERAKALVENEADVLVGSSSISPGVIAVSEELGLPFFGNQVDNSDLSPDNVVASQVYRWEAVLGDLIAGINAGDPGGDTYVLTLDNGGLVIEYNPGYELTPEVLTEADALVETVKTGDVQLTLDQ